MHKEIIVLKKYVNKQGEDKYQSTKIGVAFPDDRGGYTLKFEMFPTTAEPWIKLQDPRPRQDSAPQAGDADVPF